MAASKIAVTIDSTTLTRLDRLVREHTYPNRRRSWDSTIRSFSTRHCDARAAARALARIHRLPDDILNAVDPLAEILARHKDTSPEWDDMF